MNQCSVYKSEPIEIIDGIPIFEHVRDGYLRNYARIASDHIAAMSKEVDNPFIDTELWRQLEDSTRELVGRYSSPGTRVLDAGVGLGRVMAPFDTLERFGIDISLDYLSRAKAAGIDAVFARIEDLPYKDEVFDLVIACDVLEHVIDLHKCCAEILRVLKKDGTLIIRVPYLDDLEAYLDESIPYEFIHLRSFDVPALRLQFEKIFGCQYVEHSFVAPYLKGAPRLKIRHLKANSKTLGILANIPLNGHPLSLLKRAAAVTEEEFINWIYELKKNTPALFDQVAEDLVYGLEVNVVFKKARTTDFSRSAPNPRGI